MVVTIPRDMAAINARIGRDCIGYRMYQQMGSVVTMAEASELLSLINPPYPAAKRTPL